MGLSINRYTFVFLKVSVLGEVYDLLKHKTSEPRWVTSTLAYVERTACVRCPRVSTWLGVSTRACSDCRVDGS